MAQGASGPDDSTKVQYVLTPDDLDYSKINRSLEFIEFEFNRCRDHWHEEGIKLCLEQERMNPLSPEFREREAKVQAAAAKGMAYQAAWEWIQKEAKIITENTTPPRVQQTENDGWWSFFGRKKPSANSAP